MILTFKTFMKNKMKKKMKNQTSLKDLEIILSDIL